MEALKNGGVTVVEPEELVDLLENSWTKEDRFTESWCSLYDQASSADCAKLRARWRN